MQFTNQKIITIVVCLLLIIIIFFNKSLFTISDLEYFSNKYINLCRNGPTQLYSNNSDSIPVLSETTLSPSNNMSGQALCAKSCDENENCNMYSYTDGSCKLYNLSNTNKVYIDCNNKKIVDTEFTFKDKDNNTINPTYLGVGRVNTKYYNENNDNFKTIPYLYNKFNEIKTINEGIQIDLNKLSTKNYGSETKEQIRDRISGVYKCIDASNNIIDNTDNCTPGTLNEAGELVGDSCSVGTCKRDLKNSEYGKIITEFNRNKIGGYLGLKDNKIFSNLADTNNISDFAPPDWDKNININGKTINYTDFMIDYDKEKDKNDILDSKLTDVNLQKNSTTGFMIIMTIILIISLFILYVFITNKYVISNTFIITYFIIVTLFLYIIHKTFKPTDKFSLRDKLLI